MDVGGAGGGGAGGGGQSPSVGTGGNGGPGVLSSITGASVRYCAGGNGSGIGGSGSYETSAYGRGGLSTSNGQPGVGIVRWTTAGAPDTTTNGTKTVDGSSSVITFTGDGTFTLLYNSYIIN